MPAARWVAGVLPRPLSRWAEDLRGVGNPYAIRDLRSRVRGFRFPLLLLVYHAIVIGISLIAVAIYAALRTPNEPAGRFIFPYLVYTQLVLAPIVSAVLTAASVTTERERQTLDLVLMTPLHGLEIAVGKLAVPWGLTMLVAGTSAPYAVLCMVGGGVAPGSVLLLYLGLAVFCGITGAFGLLMSVVSRSSASAVIATLVTYAAWVSVGITATGMVAMVTLGGVLPGPIGWVHGPYTYLFPTTWAVGVLSGDGTACQVFGQRIPFWLPGVVIWGVVGLYMILAAGCRLSVAPRRHLIARRVLGLLSWTVTLTAILGGVWEDVLAGRATSPLSDSVWAVLGAVAMVGSAVVAFQCAVGECPDLWLQPLRTVIRRLLTPWRVLEPRPEASLSLGLLVWAIAAAVPFMGHVLVHGPAMPPGMTAPHLATMAVPQVFTIVYAALIGLWANARFPDIPQANARRNAAAVRLVPLVAWPLVVFPLSAAIEGPLRVYSPASADAFAAVALYVLALSPFSHPILFHMSTMSSPGAMMARVDLGPVALQPHGISTAIAIGLCAAATVTLVGRWRANSEWLASQSYSMGPLKLGEGTSE